MMPKLLPERVLQQRVFKALTPQQRGGTERGPKGVCGQVVPTCAAAGKPHLMQLVENTHGQGAEKSQCQRAPTPQATGIADRPGQHSKHGRVHQLVPRRGHQTNGHWLRTANQQAQRQGNGEQRGCQP